MMHNAQQELLPVFSASKLSRSKKVGQATGANLAISNEKVKM
jgi:hypothetical protein